MRLGFKSLSLRKPSEEKMEQCAEQGGSAGPNHLLVGASQQYESHDGRTRVTRFSDGWIEDYDAVKVGEGKQAYKIALEAVKSWRHMSLPWVDTNKPAIKVGSRVCIAAKMLGLWQRNPLEIVYVSGGKSNFSTVGNGSNGAITRRKGCSFAFGQTTLRGHALAGEERFSVRWMPDNSVWYEMYAFSRAKTVLALAAYPVRRFFQLKFRRDSARKMADAIRVEHGRIIS